MQRRNRIEARIDPLDLPFIQFTLAERDSLRRLARSSDVKDRRLCVQYLRRGVLHRRNVGFLIELCDRLIPDRSRYVRWQALLLLGQFVESEPEMIWQKVLKWGSGESRDIRTGIACCVLEHLLEHHYSTYFPKVKELIERGNRKLANTLSHCYKLGETEKPGNAAMFDELIGKFGEKVRGIN